MTMQEKSDTQVEAILEGLRIRLGLGNKESSPDLYPSTTPAMLVATPDPIMLFKSALERFQSTMKTGLDEFQATMKSSLDGMRDELCEFKTAFHGACADMIQDIKETEDLMNVESKSTEVENSVSQNEVILQEELFSEIEEIDELIPQSQVPISFWEFRRGDTLLGLYGIRLVVVNQHLEARSFQISTCITTLLCAYQLFDIMLLEVNNLKRKTMQRRIPKSWKFKYKLTQQRRFSVAGLKKNHLGVVDQTIQDEIAEPEITRLCREAEESIVAGKWLELASLMVTSAELVSSKIYEKDLECTYTIICSLVKNANRPEDVLEMVKAISAKVVQQPNEKASLRLKILFNLYNLLDHPYARFQVYMKALTMAVEGKVTEYIIPSFKKIDNFLKEWNIDTKDQRELFLAIANVLREHKSLVKESLKFLTKYLATFSKEDAQVLVEAKEEAVRAVIELVKASSIFQCDVWDLPAVAQLEKDAKYAPIYQLLKIFLTQRLHAYSEFQTAKSECLQSYGLVDEDCVMKMRLLSLVDLASDEFGKIPYTLIKDTLQNLSKSGLKKLLNVVWSEDIWIMQPFTIGFLWPYIRGQICLGESGLNTQKCAASLSEFMELETDVEMAEMGLRYWFMLLPSQLVVNHWHSELLQCLETVLKWNFLTHCVFIQFFSWGTISSVVFELLSSYVSRVWDPGRAVAAAIC